MEANTKPKIIGYYTALSLVVANMVGTGVFTTLGLQAASTHDGLALLILWGIGGLVALSGALSYGELAATLPRSGGEYYYLSKIYHPVLGTAAGWISVTVGFAAPVALAAMALGHYAATFTPLPPIATAIATIVVVTAFHAIDIRLGKRFQNVTTALKLMIITVFCAVGLLHSPVTDDAMISAKAPLNEILTPSYGASLIYVAYAYAGWNAAVYVSSEVINPQRVIPRALVHGTLLVTLLYLTLNFVFLRTIPHTELVGTVEVGAVSAIYLFGPQGGVIMSALLCVLLVSTISAMVLAGPRIIQAIGEDIPWLKALSVRSHRDAPWRAIVLQQVLALGFVATDSFEGVLSFAGFTLTLLSLLTVMGVIVLRHTAPQLPRPYRVWGYPLTPMFFIVINFVTLVFVLKERPLAAIAGLGAILLALVTSHQKSSSLN